MHAGNVKVHKYLKPLPSQKFCEPGDSCLHKKCLSLFNSEMLKGPEVGVFHLFQQHHSIPFQVIITADMYYACSNT